MAGYVDAKLPNIEIAKFYGSLFHWPRFWGQFVGIIRQAIHSTSQQAVAYLCGYLGPKVKTPIEGLPFTPEGYNRAKSILEDRYGKDSEVVKAYMKVIVDLPMIPNANAKKLHDFSDSLTHAVRALQTMKKLETVNG